MIRLPIIAVILPFMLIACNSDPGGFKAQKEWLAQKKEEQLAYEHKTEEEQKNRIEKQRQDEAQFNSSHPEVSVAGVGNELKGKDTESLRDAYNNMPFLTRDPGTTDPRLVYVYIGDYKLNVQLINASVASQLTECKRISAYTDVNINRSCFSHVGDDLSMFADTIKNPQISGLVKKAALQDATFGTSIDFGHAARLVRMHTTLCKQQGNTGYVEMATLAVPCS